ncbi:MAG: preprotein translocase subunit SecG [Actinomycetota bacterium]
MGNVLKIIVLVIHIIVSTGLIISVLLHSGKGGGISGVLGGASASVFSGSYVVEKNLDRITIVLGSVFAVTTLLLVWFMNPS